MSPSEDELDVLRTTLRGALCWQPRAGEGALLTLELGVPPQVHVDELRGPEGELHREVEVGGRHQLAVMPEASFRLRTGRHEVTEASEADELDAALDALAGQYLVAVEGGSGEGTPALLLRFDLGAELMVGLGPGGAPGDVLWRVEGAGATFVGSAA
ncbi:MAG: hypothetical protein AAGH15_16385 [Myxococcota bacterium]